MAEERMLVSVRQTLYFIESEVLSIPRIVPWLECRPSDEFFEIRAAA